MKREKAQLLVATEPINFNWLSCGTNLSIRRIEMCECVLLKDKTNAKGHQLLSDPFHLNTLTFSRFTEKMNEYFNGQKCWLVLKENSSFFLEHASKKTTWGAKIAFQVS